MRVLLTGGTGFLGRELGKCLVRKGHQVTVVTRAPEKYKGQMPYPCELVSWENLLTYLKQTPVENVIHLAGESVAAKKWTSKVKQEILDSRVLNTQKLLKIYEDSHVSLKKFISASAIGFYGDRGEEILHEESPAGTGFLADVCQQWESAVWKAKVVHSNVNVCILRIGIVLGENGGALEQMAPPFQNGYGAPLGSGRQWMSWVHIQDLVKMFVWCLENQKAEGVYNAVEPDSIRHFEFSKKLADLFGKSLLMKVPAFMVKVLFGEMSTVLLASQKVLPRKFLAEGFEFQHTSLGATLKDVLDHLKNFETKLVFEQWLPHPVEKVFSFYENEQNLEQITPPWLHFQVSKKSTATLQAGTLLDYKLKLHGIPMHWKTLIESFDKNKSFVDTQKKGPYKKWHHTHEFETLAQGTLVRDTIKYKVALGGVGYLATHWAVHKDIKKIFQYRAQKIASLFQ